MMQSAGDVGRQYHLVQPSDARIVHVFARTALASKILNGCPEADARMMHRHVIGLLVGGVEHQASVNGLFAIAW